MRRRARYASAIGASWASAALLAAACGLDIVGDGSIQLPPREAGDDPPDAPVVTPDAGVGDADAAGPLQPCPAPGRGPTLIAVADASFCIDATEVTNRDYDAFLASTDGGDPDAAVGVELQPPECAGNVTFGRKGAEGPDGGAPDRPVERITWCDARAFCAWAGKRLCGHDPASDAGEWYVACSAGGARAYPYGDTHVEGACWDNGQAAEPQRVGSRTACEGGVAGLFDMSGNVEEWIDSCAAGSCTAAGSWHGSPPEQSSCDRVSSYTLGASARAVGFRCCADAR